MIEKVSPPRGFDTCNVYRGNVQTSHLVRLVGNGTPGPTMCGLTRFDQRNEDYEVVRKADLPGWSMRGGGCFGPGIEQRPCAPCFAAAAQEPGREE